MGISVHILKYRNGEGNKWTYIKYVSYEGRKKIMLKLSARAAKVQSLHIFTLLLNKSKTKTIHSKKKNQQVLKKIT